MMQMPIWSLTQERVDKLKSQMAAKKEEQVALERLSEKDLWCQDLDAFVNEWEIQLKEEADYQKTIRNTNRRASRKIGAGKPAGKARKGDDDYAPKAAKAAPKIIKVEPKKSQNAFINMFNKKPAPKTGMGIDGTDDDKEESEPAAGLSDDDFDALMTFKRSQSASQTSRAPSQQPAAGGRTKRAAAAAPKKWIVDDDDDESESDDDGFLGNIGDMVKGIGGGDPDEKANGRVSLFAMTRPESSHGRATSNDFPKVKSKPSKTFDISDGDETNYEMLARSSPQKAPPTTRDNLDSFLSMDDDDDILPVAKKAPAKAPASKAPAKLGSKSKAAVKPAPVAKKAPESKPVLLSPAAKAYAAKQKKNNIKKPVFSEDEEENEDVDMDDDDDEDDSIPPQPAARSRGRPARAASVVTKKPIYVDSEDDDSMDVDENDDSAMVEDEPSDDFDESE
jgi:DNA topoisomerase II